MKVLLTVAFSAFTTEWLCQLPLEVRHIWKSKQWSLLNVLFLLSRYVVMANLIFIMVSRTISRSLRPHTSRGTSEGGQGCLLHLNLPYV